MTRCVFVGRSTLDLVYATQGFAEENTKIFASDFLAQAGGPALNAAITFSLLGGEAILYSAVGAKGMSSFIKDELARYDVQLHDLADPEFSAPVSTVIVNLQNGSRTIVNAPLNPPKLIDAKGVQTGPEASLVLADGFLLAEFGDLIAHYANAGATICLDGGSWKPGLADCLNRVSVAICSERFLPPGISGTSGVIDYLHERGIGQVAISRGEKAILGSEHGRRFEIGIETAKVIDTLGAGDVLHGAFCWYRAQGLSFQESLREASQIATRKCGGLGARVWTRTSHYATRKDAG